MEIKGMALKFEGSKQNSLKCTSISALSHARDSS